VKENRRECIYGGRRDLGRKSTGKSAAVKSSLAEIGNQQWRKKRFRKVNV